MPRRTNGGAGTYFTHMRDAEKAILLFALEAEHGKVSPAAKLIGITNGYMRKLMEKHGLLVRRKKEQGGYELTLSPEVPRPPVPVEPTAAAVDPPVPVEAPVVVDMANGQLNTESEEP